MINGIHLIRLFYFIFRQLFRSINYANLILSSERLLIITSIGKGQLWLAILKVQPPMLFRFIWIWGSLPRLIKCFKDKGQDMILFTPRNLTLDNKFFEKFDLHELWESLDHLMRSPSPLRL